MNNQSELIDWLRDVYALEKALETALHKLTAHPHDHAPLREQAALHSIQVRRHADVIAACLKQFGSETSSLKTILAQGMGMDFMKGAGRTFAREERIKDVLTVLVTEHFEIACLTILRTGASQLGLQEIVRICDQMVCENKRMVKWLQLNLPEIFTVFLAPEKAKEAKDEEVFDFAQDRNGSTPDLVHWEFVQLSQNASLFGGPLPRTVFASMQS